MRRTIAIAALVTGCASPAARTEVMLEIDAEPGVRAAGAQLHVEIFGGEEGRPPAGYVSRYDRTLEPAWPHRVALVPLDPEPARAWLAEIEALSVSGDVVAATAVRGGYDDMRTVLVRVVLEEACIGVACEGQRCESGRCVDPLVDVAGAPDLEE